MKEYIPGKRCFKGFKLNTNENAFSLSKNCFLVYKIILKNLNILKFYPDSENFHIKKILSKIYKIKINNIFVSNGSDEGLFFIFFLLKNYKIIIPKLSYPFYNVYVNFLKIYNKKVNFYNIFKFKNIIFPNPNSPSGEYINKKKIIKKINKKQIIIIDEAYSEFYNLGYKKHINTSNNLVITNTLSKAFSGAGLRIGFIFSNKKIIKKINKIKQCFNSYTIDTINNILSIECLKDKNFLYYKIQKINYIKLLLNIIFKKKNKFKGNFICLIKNNDFNYFFLKKYLFFRFFKKEKKIRITVSNYKILKKIFFNNIKWS